MLICYQDSKYNPILFRNFPSQRDDFDIIMDHDKEKHNQIKQKLLSFVNINLGKTLFLKKYDISTKHFEDV